MVRARSVVLLLQAIALFSANDARAGSPVEVHFFDLDAARSAEGLEYDELALVFTLQGLVNRLESPPKLMLNAAFLNFDWPLADAYWRNLLQGDGRVAFRNITSPSICALVEAFPASKSNYEGAVLYQRRPFWRWVRLTNSA